MSGTARVTVVLAVILAALVAVDVGVNLSGPAEVEALPVLPGVRLGEVQTVRISREGETMVFERVGDSSEFNLTQPVEGPADSAAIRDLLVRLRSDIPMQVRVDQGNLAEYGLESGKAIRLEMFEDPDAAAVLDVYVGADTVGGASFVRFPDDDVVYRAPVGGRHRLDRPARDWRDPTVFGFSADAASGLWLRFGEEDLRFARRDDRWVLEGEPDFGIDQKAIEDTLSRLGSLRAGRVLPGDFPLEGPPLLRVRVLRDGLEPVELRFFQEGKLAYVTRDGRDQVFQITSSLAGRIAMPRLGWRDRQLIDLDRADIQTMTLNDRQQGRFVLEQDAADSRWRMIEPSNVDANLRDSMQAAIALSQLRAEGIADVPLVDAGFPSENWIELRTRGGRTVRLELGKQTVQGDQRLLFVRTDDAPERVAAISLRTFLNLRNAWGR